MKRKTMLMIASLSVLISLTYTYCNNFFDKASLPLFVAVSLLSVLFYLSKKENEEKGSETDQEIEEVSVNEESTEETKQDNTTN
jgi:uncharacterized membrane protein